MKGKRGKGLTAFQGWTSENLMRTILNKKPVFWLLLSIPAVLMLSGYWRGAIDSMDMLHPTGEWSVRFMVLAMLIGPLSDLLGRRPWLVWLVQRRRYLGVASFGYACLHLLFYIIDMGTIADMLDEINIASIWTGWLAIFLMLAPALASNQTSMRVLRAGWKRVQQLAYPAALLIMAHWILLEWETLPVVVHFGPLIVLNIARVIVLKRRLKCKNL
jgi:methionine sulfoxide reductase heme-binding subunit